MTKELLAQLGKQLRTCLLCGGSPYAIGVFVPDHPTDLNHMLTRADVVPVDPEGTALAYALCDQHPLGEAVTSTQVEAVLTAKREGTFEITYATGKVFALSGEFRVMEPFPGSHLLVPVILAKGIVNALDPRAVVRDHTGLTLFVGCSTAQLEADNEQRRPQIVRGSGKTEVITGE